MGPPESIAKALNRETIFPADTKFVPNITHFKPASSLAQRQCHDHCETANMSAAVCIFAS